MPEALVINKFFFGIITVALICSVLSYRPGKTWLVCICHVMVMLRGAGAMVFQFVLNKSEESQISNQAINICNYHVALFWFGTLMNNIMGPLASILLGSVIMSINYILMVMCYLQMTTKSSSWQTNSEQQKNSENQASLRKQTPEPP